MPSFFLKIIYTFLSRFWVWSGSGFGQVLVVVRFWFWSGSGFGQVLVVVRFWLWSGSGFGQVLVVVRIWFRSGSGFGQVLVLVMFWLWLGSGFGQVLVLVRFWLWSGSGCGQVLVLVRFWLWLGYRFSTIFISNQVPGETYFDETNTFFPPEESPFCVPKAVSLFENFKGPYLGNEGGKGLATPIDLDSPSPPLQLRSHTPLP